MTEPPTSRLDRALDERLSRALDGPKIPDTFRTRLNAALSRATETDLLSLRERLERERRQQAEELEAHYVHVRRSTLGTLIGAAFAAGAAAAIAMPWLRAHLGDFAPVAITWGAVALGLVIVFLEPLRTHLRRWSGSG